ncbi:MAG: hypothetical protein WD768_00965 [Phycisphaeraceae bacterium]
MMPVLTTRFLSRSLFSAVAALMLIAAVGCSTAPNSVLRLEAKQALDKKDYVTAEQRLDRALIQDPADWKAQYYLGKLRLAQSRPLDARLALEIAYSLRDSHPETPDVIDALAEAYRREPVLEKLHTLLKTANRRYGTTRDYLRQAHFLGLIGDVDGAKVAFLKAQEFRKGDDITPFVKAADFYEGLGDRVNATIALRQALQIEPKNLVLLGRLQNLQATPTPSVGATGFGLEEK